jgi:hypothetical protein
LAAPSYLYCLDERLENRKTRQRHPWQEQTMAQAAKPQSQPETKARPAPAASPVVAQQTPSKGAVYTDFASI